MQILVPGAFCHFLEIVKFISQYPVLKNHCEVYDSIENSDWNGGRIECLAPTKFDFKKVDYFNSKNIGVVLTFSNSKINLDSKRENKILEFLNQCNLNGVIIRNDDLRKHIRSNYKNLNVQLSITENKGLDFRSLIREEEKYDMICPRPEFVFNKDFLNLANKSKYKIMVNNVCNIRCRFWNLHADSISEAIQQNINDEKKARLVNECWKRTGKIVTPFFVRKCRKYKDIDRIDVDYSESDIKNAILLGYDKFKISGRELKGEVYRDEIETYLTRILNAFDF